MSGHNRRLLQSLAGYLFHEPWWLAAVTDGKYDEAVVERGGQVVGRLPYVITFRGPFRVARMPQFTHVLGPWVDTGSGKPQTRLNHRLSITRALIDQLPPLALFEQHIDPSADEGFANADGLAFQDRGFVVSPQYTFEIDCRRQPDALWEAMHFKTRQHIRRAGEKYTIRVVENPGSFAEAYVCNLRAKGMKNRLNFERFPELYAQCRSRGCGEILGAFAADGTPVSMAYLVWSATRMYYLLSTRNSDPNDNGSVSLVLWSSMKLAHERGLVFDLDGVYTRGSAEFLSRFGGRVRIRYSVRRSRMAFRVLRQAKLLYSRNETQYFT
jgi:Acetyltransferase (GNAT) domain